MASMAKKLMKLRNGKKKDRAMLEIMHIVMNAASDEEDCVS